MREAAPICTLNDTGTEQIPRFTRPAVFAFFLLSLNKATEKGHINRLPDAY